MILDEFDKKLVRLLQEDCKKTTKQYAHALGLSTTAVYERMRRLEKKGVVKQYVALVDKEKIARNFTVLCHVRLVQHTKENVRRFEREIQKLESVSECFHISGDYDYMLKINVADVKAYREFMVNKLTAIEHIGSTQSSFVITDVKDSTVISL